MRNWCVFLRLISSFLRHEVQDTVCTMFAPYPEGVQVPHYHPIISYLTLLWDEMLDKE